MCMPHASPFASDLNGPSNRAGLISGGAGLISGGAGLISGGAGLISGGAGVGMEAGQLVGLQ